MPNFPIISLYFAGLLALVTSNNHYNIHLQSELITAQPASKSVIMTKVPSSSQPIIFVSRMKVFMNTIFEHYSQKVYMKTVSILFY